MRYYLKKCGSQELGSVIKGKPQRGRYLFTPMNDDVLSMFPPLSSIELNDSTILPIIPLYSGKKVYCNFVYHNSKNATEQKNGRNEYRIYLNQELEENKYLFKPEDIVIIRQEEIDSDDGKQIVYLLDLIQNHNTALYRDLNIIIDNSDIRGGYGITKNEIPEFEEKAARINVSATSDIVIDSSVTERIEKKADSIANLFNASSFRDFVMVGYNSLCAVTGTVIRYGNYTNLEAAHIWPKSHKGLYVPNNGIAMCRDIHWAFDKGFFTINDQFEIVVHPKTTSEYLCNLDGKKIYLPKDSFFCPSPDNIEYHSENVYGLFLTSGRL